LFATEFIKDNLGDEFISEGMPQLDKVLKTYTNPFVVIIKQKGS